ncbi:hypothetical protein D9757_011832 [Collybiopsis confluens]|uniref:Uncharacterized protein n=1 Tax=Collybiopsis confluens TaxID=2823264 RepID=A0A8H5LYP7_9AGAR|nr:hypothetical protein D9757_011832 [Collybiopsis confluens]
MLMGMAGHVSVCIIPESAKGLDFLMVRAVNDFGIPSASLLHISEYVGIIHIYTPLTCKFNMLTTKIAESKRLEARDIIAKSGYYRDFLSAQWTEQVNAQTRPLPRQTKNAGKVAVEQALCLQKACDTLRQQISGLENTVTDISAEMYRVVEAESELEQLRPKLQQIELELTQQEQALGVEGRSSYHHLVSSPYIQLRMNARALMMRLREKLRARKFELDRGERSFWRQQYNERKIMDHTADSIKQQDPGIQALANGYNTLSNKMAALIQSKRAPCNAVAPPPIVMKTLLGYERRAMREWMAEEWKIVVYAIKAVGSEEGE